MIDRREDQVHQIYLNVLKRAMEALRAGLYRELDFFNELEFTDSRKLILTSPAKEQIVVKKYSEALSTGFQQWNLHYENDPHTLFTTDEINFLSSEVSEFLKNGLPGMPAWVSNDPPSRVIELYTVLAFSAAIDAFDEDGGEFKDPASWLRACQRASQVISLYVDSRDQDHISEMFQLTYPASGAFGTEVRVRKRGKYVPVIVDHEDDRKKDKSYERDGGEDSE
jgi:hypothetical protein